MKEVRWERFPAVGEHEQCRRWLQFTANIGRAPNTVDAYGRALQDYLTFCATSYTDPITARADVIAAWIGDMRRRPNLHGGDKVGLSDATVQQRVIAVRGFYDFLVEDQLRERNPVRRGQSGRHREQPRQGLVRVAQKAPWIPDEHAWGRILQAARSDTLRNRLMLCLGYDGALRREELVSLQIGDLEPAWSLIHVRAEATKSPARQDGGVRRDLRRTVGGLPAPPHRRVRQGRRKSVPQRVPAQSRRGSRSFGMVEDRHRHCSTCPGARVVDTHVAALEVNRSGAGGMGHRRDRAIRRPPRLIHHPDLYPPVRARTGSEVSCRINLTSCRSRAPTGGAGWDVVTMLTEAEVATLADLFDQGSPPSH